MKNLINQNISGGNGNKNHIEYKTITELPQPTPTAQEALSLIIGSYSPTQSTDTTEGIELLTPAEIAAIVLAATGEQLGNDYIYQQLGAAGFIGKLFSVPGKGFGIFFPATKK